MDQQPVPTNAHQIALDNSQRYCVFQSGGCSFGLSALAVRSIVPRPEMTHSPHSDPTLHGICHLQNEFLPVVSFQALRKIEYDRSPGTEQQLMIVLGPQGAWGLLIDQAIGLAELETSISTISNSQDRWSRVVVGSASYENQVLQIIDANALYEFASQLLERYWQNSDVHQDQLTGIQ